MASMMGPERAEGGEPRSAQENEPSPGPRPGTCERPRKGPRLPVIETARLSQAAGYVAHLGGWECFIMGKGRVIEQGTIDDVSANEARCQVASPAEPSLGRSGDEFPRDSGPGKVTRRRRERERQPSPRAVVNDQVWSALGQPGPPAERTRKRPGTRRDRAGLAGEVGTQIGALAWESVWGWSRSAGEKAGGGCGLWAVPGDEDPAGSLIYCAREGTEAPAISPSKISSLSCAPPLRAPRKTTPRPLLRRGYPNDQQSCHNHPPKGWAGQAADT